MQLLPSIRLLRVLVIATSLLIASAGVALAQSSTLEGRLEVIVADDFEHRASKLDHYLVDARGKRTKLQLRKQREDLLTGDRVRIRGEKLAGSAFRVGSTPDSFEVLERAKSPKSSRVSIAAVSGSKTAIILRIQSSTAVSPGSETQWANDLVNAGARASAASFGQISIDSDKDRNGLPDVRTVTVATNTAGLGESSAFSLCDSAKTAAGVSGYNHYICILPPDMNYGWYGQAYIGGVDAVLNGNYPGYPNGLLHEIAHNWGQRHANTAGTEYGDSTCIQGGNAGTGDRFFNGPHTMALGWLPATNVSAGTFDVHAVELSSGTRLLKIRDPVANEDLYISTRARVGGFASGPINPGMTHVHTYPGGSSSTVAIAYLGNGQSFSRNGITITQLAHSGTVASVQVGVVCAAADPLLQLSPAAAATNVIGASQFDLVVTNRSTNCDPETFSLTSQSASSSVATASASVALAPGQSARVPVTVAVASGSAIGVYSFSVSASSTSGRAASINGTLTYDTISPTAPGSLAATTKQRSVTLKWISATDSGPAKVVAYSVYKNGILAASTSATSFSESLAQNTTVTYSIRAVDAAGNEGPSSNSVTVSTAKKGR